MTKSCNYTFRFIAVRRRDLSLFPTTMDTIHSYFFLLITQQLINGGESRMTCNKCLGLDYDWPSMTVLFIIFDMRFSCRIVMSHHIQGPTVYLCDSKSDADSTDPHQVFQQEVLHSPDTTLRKSTRSENTVFSGNEMKCLWTLKWDFPADLCVYFLLLLSTTLALHHAAGIWHGIVVFPAHALGPVSAAVCAAAPELWHGLWYMKLVPKRWMKPKCRFTHAHTSTEGAVAVIISPAHRCCEEIPFKTETLVVILNHKYWILLGDVAQYITAPPAMFVPEHFIIIRISRHSEVIYLFTGIKCSFYSIFNFVITNQDL